MTRTEQSYINELTSALIKMVRAEYNISVSKAMDIVYGSDTFSKLERTETGLYQYGSLSICDLLQAELKTGKCPTMY